MVEVAAAQGEQAPDKKTIEEKEKLLARVEVFARVQSHARTPGLPAGHHLSGNF